MSFFLGEQFNLTGIQKNDTILRNISVPQFGLNEVLLQKSVSTAWCLPIFTSYLFTLHYYFIRLPVF